MVSKRQIYIIRGCWYAWSKLLINRIYIRQLTLSGVDTGVACMEPKVFIIASMATWSKLWLYQAIKIRKIGCKYKVMRSVWTIFVLVICQWQIPGGGCTIPCAAPSDITELSTFNWVFAALTGLWLFLRLFGKMPYRLFALGGLWERRPRRDFKYIFHCSHAPRGNTRGRRSSVNNLQKTRQVRR